MKRIIQFLCIFCILLIGAYAKPVVSPQHVKQKIEKKPKKETIKTNQVAFKPSKVGALKATSFSKFINKSTSSFTKQYGEPIEIQDNYFGNQWWIFGEDEHDYLQLEVKDNKIVSIFVLGDQIDVTPLEINMTLKDVAALTTIYSDFNSTYNGKYYEFELTEQDMNYRPLLSFDNNSFAILHFSQSTGRLLGIRYLNNELLLRLMPYQLTEEFKLDKLFGKPIEKKEISEASDRQLEMMIRIMRKRDNLPAYSFSPIKRLEAEKILEAFVKEPQLVIEEQASLDEWDENSTEHAIGVYRKFSKLKATDYQRLIKDSQDAPHGFLIKPSQDIPYVLMSIYSHTSSQKHFLNKEDNEIGIATDKENVLVMISNKKEEDVTQTSQSMEEMTSEDGK